MADEPTNSTKPSRQPRDLVECRFGLRGLPGRELAMSLMMGAAGCFAIFFFIAKVVEDSGDTMSDGTMGLMLAAGFVICATVAFLTHGMPAIRTAQRSYVAADEGGVRCRWRSLRIYWPYAMISGVKSRFGLLTLLDDGDIQLMQARLYGQGPTLEAGALRAVIEQRTQHAALRLPSAFESLRRRGRTLPEWLQTLDQEAPRAKGAKDFRAVHRDVDDLVRSFEDLRTRPDDRAAAAFALLASKAPDLAARVRAGLNSASPPIVLVLCRMAPAGRDLVDRKQLERVAEYLDEDDRTALDELLQKRSG